MTARHIHIITIVLVVALISCVGVLVVSFWTLHRMFAPGPRIVEDANSISEDTANQFIQCLGDFPTQVVVEPSQGGDTQVRCLLLCGLR